MATKKIKLKKEYLNKAVGDHEEIIYRHLLNIRKASNTGIILNSPQDTQEGWLNRVIQDPRYIYKYGNGVEIWNLLYHFVLKMDIYNPLQYKREVFETITGEVLDNLLICEYKIKKLNKEYETARDKLWTDHRLRMKKLKEDQSVIRERNNYFKLALNACKSNDTEKAKKLFDLEKEEDEKFKTEWQADFTKTSILADKLLADNVEKSQKAWDEYETKQFNESHKLNEENKIELDEMYKKNNVKVS